MRLKNRTYPYSNIVGEGSHRTMYLSSFGNSSFEKMKKCRFAYLVYLPRFWYADLDQLRYLDIEFDSAEKYIDVEMSASRSSEHIVVVFSDKFEIEIPVHLRYRDPKDDFNDNYAYRETPVPIVSSFATCDESFFFESLNIFEVKESSWIVQVPVGLRIHSDLVCSITNFAVFIGTAFILLSVLLTDTSY